MIENQEQEIITLEYDDGEKMECTILGVFDCDGKDYIALEPDDGSEDAYIYKYMEVGEDEFEIQDIEDDKEFEIASKEFEKIMDQFVTEQDEE